MLASSSKNAASIARSRVSRVSAVPLDVGSQDRRQHTAAVQQRGNPGMSSKPNIFRKDGSGTRSPNRTWAFQPDYPSQPRTSAYNMSLSKFADHGRTMQIVDALAQMKSHKLKPDIHTYHATLEGFAVDGCPEEAWAVLDDMKGMGITPDVLCYNSVLQSVRFQDVGASWRVLQAMKEAGIEPQVQTYMLLVRRFKEESNLEMALKLLFDMEGRGLSPRVETAEDVITLAIMKRQSRLAIDLAENYEASSVRRLDSRVWAQCLISATETLYADGVVRLWDKVVNELKITPDEGVCIEALHTAGRHGLPDFSMDVLRVLKAIGVDLKEYHFAPVIEAFCRTGRVKEAMATLSLMRDSNIRPTSDTAHPIFTSIQGGSDMVDTAWDALEALHAEGQTIDVTAVNVIIQASISQGDLQRAVGIYQFCPELQVKPDVETYNFLLSGCIAAQHRELGDRFISEMKGAKVTPDAQTYERLIVLCLTSPTYEDAFFYLEEMKAENFYPPMSVYEAIIRRCVADGDVRYRLALTELQEFGYTVSTKLQNFIDSGGAVQETQEGWSKRRDVREERKDDS